VIGSIGVTPKIPSVIEELPLPMLAQSSLR